MEINPFLKLILNHLRYGNKVLNNFYMIYSYRHNCQQQGPHRAQPTICGYCPQSFQSQIQYVMFVQEF